MLNTRYTPAYIQRYQYLRSCYGNQSHLHRRSSSQGHRVCTEMRLTVWSGCYRYQQGTGTGWRTLQTRGSRSQEGNRSAQRRLCSCGNDLKSFLRWRRWLRPSPRSHLKIQQRKQSRKGLNSLMHTCTTHFKSILIVIWLVKFTSWQLITHWPLRLADHSLLLSPLSHSITNTHPLIHSLSLCPSITTLVDIKLLTFSLSHSLTHTHAYTHAHTHTHIHAHTHAHTHTRSLAHSYPHPHSNPLLPRCNHNGWLSIKHQVTYLLTSPLLSPYARMYACVHAWMPAHVCTCLYVHTHA